METETLKKLDKICEITESIFNIYNSLYNLYMKDPNSKEFINMLGYLDLTLQEEEIYYNYFKNNPELAGKAVKFLLEKSDKPLASICFTALNEDEIELKQYRIITRLHLIAYKDKKYFDEDIEQDYLNLVAGEKEGKEFLQWFYPQLETETIIRTCQFIDEDYQNVYFFQKMKFFISFLEPDVEQIYLHNGFKKVKGNFKEKMPETADEISTVSLNSIYQTHGMSVVLYLLDELLEFKDEDFEIDDEEVTFYFILEEFRAALLFLDEETIKELEEIINNKINFDEYKENHEYDSIALDKIYDIIDQRHKDKKLVNKDIVGPFEL